jgi:hypothetical protein
MKTFNFLLAALLVLPLSTAALAQSSVTVIHGKTPDPTFIDLAEPGDSVGDQRIWHFDGKTSEDQPVTMDWIMTTTSKPTGSDALESRVTSAVFSFPGGGSDRILVQGIGFYPAAGSTVKTDATLERAIIGGTGKYAGAKGMMLTTHLPDGSWTHVLKLD